MEDKTPDSHLSNSIRLSKSKNVWKPAILRSVDDEDAVEDHETIKIHKSLTGMLNKLTAENFDRISKSIASLPINTLPQLQEVADLIYEKAIKEPIFCDCYAKLCYFIRDLSVTMTDNNATNVTSFSIILITKCWQEFEKNMRGKKNAVMQQENHQSLKKSQMMFDGINQQIRRRSAANCRFMGTLYKSGMVDCQAMLKCIRHLNHPEEDDIECLCTLLVTIGKHLENEIGEKKLDTVFETMRCYVYDTTYQFSKRIKFMLQDVIDLRNNKWVPRQEIICPKTINEINLEIENEYKITNTV